MSLRIAVCVAAVPNPEKVKWDRFRQLLDIQGAEPVLNPADRNALELAAQLSKSTGSAFDAYCAGAGASAALREAAAFGANRLVAVADPALETADGAGIAATLAALITTSGGADVIFCGAATSSIGSGAVPGYLSHFLNAELRCLAVAVEPADNALRVDAIDGSARVRMPTTTPVVIVTASYGVAVRTISPILLMRATKKSIEQVTIAALGTSDYLQPLATTGATDGPLESNRKRRAGEIIEGPDAEAQAITLVGALRERQLI